MTDKRFNEDIDFFDRLRATLPDKSRERLDLMERIRAKYINCDRDLELLEHIDFVVETAVTRANPNEPASKRNRREGRALVLVGESARRQDDGARTGFSKTPRLPGLSRARLPAAQRRRTIALQSQSAWP